VNVLENSQKSRNLLLPGIVFSICLTVQIYSSVTAMIRTAPTDWPLLRRKRTTLPRTCTSAVDTPCLNSTQFLPAGTLNGFGTMGRNAIYGPHFFDADIALMKDVRFGEHVTFSFGAQAYNAFNHPNFDQPVADISNPVFGSSIANVGPPTSLLGSFVGAGSSPRFLEIKGIVRF